MHYSLYSSVLFFPLCTDFYFQKNILGLRAQGGSGGMLPQEKFIFIDLLRSF